MVAPTTSPFTDFKNGLQSAADYVDPTHHIRADLLGSTADLSRIIQPAEFDTTVKKIICAMLAGNGLKLPNLQICISINLDRVLQLPNLQPELTTALGALSTSMHGFLDHLGIDSVLGRINDVMAKSTSIANMVNFCSAPLDPVAIPNVLEQSMQSFLGPGLDLLNKVGAMLPSQIGGCINANGSFNAGAFTGGMLKTIADNLPAITSGTAPTNLLASLSALATSLSAQIDALIASENTVKSVYDAGGTNFSLLDPINTGMGVLHNTAASGIQGNTAIASQLRSLYNNLGSYQVVDNAGVVYNNIFELFVNPAVMDILRTPPDPTAPIITKQPAYNYCGEVIGYTNITVNPQLPTSGGDIPVVNTAPGFNAAGLTVNPPGSTGAGSGTGTGTGTGIIDLFAGVPNGILVKSSTGYAAVGNNSANWNIAYGWGNHSTAGYLTSIGTITLPTLSDVVVAGIAINQSLKWNGTVWANAPTIANGTYGDIVATSAGATLTVANGAISLSKMAAIPANTFIGRAVGLGTPVSLTATAARSILNVANGATPDQTPLQILTAIKTVDGTLSGLDADLLDGQHGAFYQNGTNINAGVINALRLPPVLNVTTLANNGSATARIRITPTVTISDQPLQVTGSITVNAFNVKTASTATVAVMTPTVVTQFVAATYSGGKILINTTDSTTGARQITELLVTHNGTIAVSSVPSTISTGGALATFTVDILGGNVRILATDISANSTIHRATEDLFVV
jgi:hypothetical protein